MFKIDTSDKFEKKYKKIVILLLDIGSHDEVY